jgi:hypothetical protein
MQSQLYLFFLGTKETPEETEDIRPVENEELFDHLFIT